MVGEKRGRKGGKRDPNQSSELTSHFLITQTTHRFLFNLSHRFLSNSLKAFPNLSKNVLSASPAKSRATLPKTETELLLSSDDDLLIWFVAHRTHPELPNHCYFA